MSTTSCPTPPHVLPLSRERQISNSVRTELNAVTTSVSLVGCSGRLASLIPQ
jgi:hypothetical protein